MQNKCKNSNPFLIRVWNLIFNLHFTLRGAIILVFAFQEIARDIYFAQEYSNKKSFAEI